MLDESEDVLVETLQGPVRGEMLSGIRVFRGIPYAAPPTGDRRFLPLEPAESWTEPRDATRFGSAAPQFPDPLDDLRGRLAPGDEDCASLNIWAPARPADRPRPVMVWIHGGAFVIGSGKWPWYEGCNLAQRGDVVLVTINYRLGALGFLDLSELGDDRHRTCGNHGLLDQVCALRWIRDNIERFGGDPKNVTLFGESAGGISIACLLAMPEARGLFQRVIVMSVGANLIRFPKLSREVARTYLKIAGVESVAECSRLPTKVLMKAQKRLLDRNEYGGDAVFGPVVDGRVLPEPPLHAIRSGCASEVGLMTGTTLDEARLWSLYVPILRWAHPRALGRVLHHAVGDRGREVVSAYRRSRLGDRPGNLSMAINGDLLFRMPAIRLAEAQSEHRPHDTRMYLFTWSTPVSRGRLGSPHAVDVPFVFGNLDQEGVERFTGKGADRRELSMRIQDAWLAFARTGDPSHSGLPHWPPYRRDSRATMIFDSSPTVVDDPRPEERKAWDGVPFDGVVPAIEQSLPTTGEILRSLVPNPFSRA